MPNFFIINNGRVHVQGTPVGVITPQNIGVVYGVEHCVYAHPDNGLPIVLLEAGNSKNAAIRNEVENNIV